MTTANFRKVLIDIAKEENSNTISRIIAYYYPSLNSSSRESLFESLMFYLETSEGQELDFEDLSEKIKTDNIDVLAYRGKDYRIKQVEISNLRGIPSLEENNGIPFGIDLTDEGEKINNAIILANNGTGKSSVFAGLEMIYTQEIGEKNLRSKNPKANELTDYNKYLQRINQTGKISCNVKTVEGDFDLENKIFENDDLIKIFNPNSHFITEYDIISNGQLEYEKDDKHDHSFHNKIALSLGLNEFINFQKIALQIPNYRRSKETSTRNNIEKEIQNNKTTIINRHAEIQSKTIELEEFKKGNTSENTSIQLSRLQTLNKLKSKTLELNFEEKKYLNDILEFENKVRELSTLERNKKTAVEKNFLESGKELINEFHDCPFCLSSNKSLEEIKAEVEKRLLQLEQSKLLDEQLKNSFRSVAENLWNITRDLNYINEILDTDRQDLSNFSNFEKIRLEESRLYISLSPIISDMKLNEHIYSLTQKIVLTDKDYLDLFEFLNNNKQMFEKAYIDLAKEVQSLIEERKKTIDAEINEFLRSNESNSIEHSISRLEREIKEINEQITSIENKNKKLEEELIPANKKVVFLNQIKEEIDIFNSKYKLKVDELVNNVFEPIKNTVEEILNDYFQDDPQYKLEINLKENKLNIEGIEYVTKYIVAEIVNTKTNDMISSPQIYFNTFRYKLFSLMIGLSIALASRKTYKINFPLVMDDLFFASDFINKNSFSDFLQKVIQLFYKHTPDIPLQIILFTHDDIIFRSSIDAIYEFKVDENNNSHKVDLVENTIIARMFNVSEKDEKTQTFKDNSEYWSLLYELPKKINYEQQQ
ncbi:MAG: hypothetical protein LCH35_05660 [Bacteroidetes bacterium]|jgi:hypothetical protein|uniref:hypothetical protein n=1 Tax=Flavobacterium sp. TaxID=239 RepID=UPI002FD9E898|nr:hypothetical protein [Bacteroidota bacterium]